jgi:hypothetical protein
LVASWPREPRGRRLRVELRLPVTRPLPGGDLHREGRRDDPRQMTTAREPSDEASRHLLATALSI